ncbi:PREDICTED: uncharacterized protein LOC104793852 [Camelina sativa]|uniref:Uncharacterized protein LOC104793852 n=1 Tax=Camelina sativa TaxID=90675 RepID=A0ABM0ZPA4_CAMSA|nr:PREDICTED: uncharacterized protein LOC104793852 [Camelina sativa]
MTRLSEPIQSRSAVSAAPSQHGHGSVFQASFSAGSTGPKGKFGKKRRRPNQWHRKAQALAEGSATSQTSKGEEGEVETSGKRKAIDEALVSSKVAKRDAMKVVPNGEPPKQAISAWKRNTNQNSKERISQLRHRLEEEGEKLYPNFHYMKTLRWDLAAVYREEELFWKQQSKEKWLREGHQNTRFFHGSVQRRRVQNRILSLLDVNGIEQFSEGSKGEIAVEYFCGLFARTNPDMIAESLNGLLPRVTNQMNDDLTRDVTAEEIRLAAFSIRGDSTPGADGMSRHFYQHYWDTVGTQVVEEIVSKVMCNRLNRFLPEIVSDIQVAFVSGRLISDNILLAHEMVHALRTNPNCDLEFLAIKTDMSKAYDRVEWSFLEELLLRLVLVNGASYGFIKPERVLRQGDPLSPFLFILCAEALVHIMNRAELEGRLTCLRLTPFIPSIQHLLFADDSLFLCRATFQECSEFLACLQLYGRTSGQEINFQKSTITFGKKMDPYMKRIVGLFTGIEQEEGTSKYLGLPECFSGSKRALLNFITDRLKSRLGGWYEKTLSLGGKEVLLKSVAIALPVYAMSCFRLTKHQCHLITSTMASFWWKESEDKHKMHWVSWEKLCASKESGGLGFKDIGRFNQALLAKQAWRLLDSPTSLLARVYKAKYYADTSLLKATIGYRPSYAWRSIMFGRELLEKGVMKSIGDGKSTNIWLDRWIFDESPRRPFNREMQIDLNLKVSTLITSEGGWNTCILHRLFPPDDVIKIQPFPPELSISDKYVWAYTTDGKYSVKSGTWQLNSEISNGILIPEEVQMVNDIKAKIWKIPTKPKIRLFLWRTLSGALAVAECLRRHGIQMNPICQECHIEEETIAHLMTRGDIPADYRNDIPWILWEIWKAQNGLIWSGRMQDPDVLLAGELENAAVWLRQRTMTLQDNIGDEQRGSGRIGRWFKPAPGVLKCNIHCAWINDRYYCGGAWILWDDAGNTKFHARDAFPPRVNRISAELGCLLWCLQNLCTLQINSCEVWMDCQAALSALEDPLSWPKYRSQVNKIAGVIQGMGVVQFKLSSPKANSLARDISHSVTRDGRLSSYLSLGGPSWLHDWIEEERRGT